MKYQLAQLWYGHVLHVVQEISDRPILTADGKEEPDRNDVQTGRAEDRDVTDADANAERRDADPLAFDPLLEQFFLNEADDSLRVTAERGQIQREASIRREIGVPRGG